MIMCRESIVDNESLLFMSQRLSARTSGRSEILQSRAQSDMRFSKDFDEPLYVLFTYTLIHLRPTCRTVLKLKDFVPNRTEFPHCLRGAVCSVVPQWLQQRQCLSIQNPHQFFPARRKQPGKSLISCDKADLKLQRTPYALRVLLNVFKLCKASCGDKSGFLLVVLPRLELRSRCDPQSHNRSGSSGDRRKAGPELTSHRFPIAEIAKRMLEEWVR